MDAAPESDIHETMTLGIHTGYVKKLDGLENNQGHFKVEEISWFCRLLVSFNCFRHVAHLVLQERRRWTDYLNHNINLV